MLTVGGLFSGIGGFELGLERAGMRVLWHCEQDEFCQRVLARHWPDVPCYPDVRALAADAVPPVDILCGGFPCQDISVAGRGAGIDGARSGLWSEFARLIGELRPPYVLVENVPALLARGFGRVLGDLAALGYDAEWDCLPASAFGAPHQRDRVWVVAYPSGDGVRVESERDQRQGRPVRATVGRDSEPEHDGSPRAVADADDAGRGEQRRPVAVRAQHAAAQRDGEDVADAEVEPVGAGLCAGAPAGQRWRRPGDGSSEGGQWAVEPNVGRVADGVPARVDRLRSLGNALVPQIAEWIGQRIVSWEGER